MRFPHRGRREDIQRRHYFYSGVPGSPHRPDAVARELSELRIVLELPKEDSDTTDFSIIPEVLHTQTLNIITNCGNAIRRVGEVLEKHSGRLGPTKWAIEGKQ